MNAQIVQLATTVRHLALLNQRDRVMQVRSSIRALYSGTAVGFTLELLSVFYCHTLFFLGYYCPPGQNISNALHCEEGYMCPLGSPVLVPCESGTYQNEIAQAECKECVAGKCNVLFF